MITQTGELTPENQRDRPYTVKPEACQRPNIKHKAMKTHTHRRGGTLPDPPPVTADRLLTDDPQPGGGPFPRIDLLRETQTELNAVRDYLRASSSIRFTIDMQIKYWKNPGMHPGCPLTTTCRTYEYYSWAVTRATD